MRTKRHYIVAACVALIALLGLLFVLIFRFIATDELNQAAKDGDTGRVERMMLSGGAMNGQGMHGMTPLMSACSGGNLDTAQYLIDSGADVNGHNVSGSALMWAVESRNAEVVELLIEHDVNVSWKNHLGEDALSFAREQGNDRIIDLLQSATDGGPNSIAPK